MFREFLLGEKVCELNNIFHCQYQSGPLIIHGFAEFLKTSSALHDGKSYDIIRLNFKRNINISPEYCIKQCQQELDNTHLTWCSYMNKENDFRFTHLLNGTLEEKIGTLNQIKMNELTRKEEKKTLWSSPYNLSIH